MKITLDENGPAFPDVVLANLAMNAISTKSDIHTSQMLMVDILRSQLFQIPQADRPEVKWLLYGVEATFDKDLRSINGWNDSRTTIWEDALDVLLSFNNPA